MSTLAENFPGLPLTANNRAQLDRVGYSADDLEGLRARLLARLAETFPQWNPDLPDNVGGTDFGVLFADLFAQMAAILNAYSDARVNESFLRTATLERSLIDLAAQVDYRLAPGASAAGLQAFLTKEGASGLIPANFKVQAPAVGATPAVIFETLAPLAVSAVRNQLRLQGYNRSSRVLRLRESSAAVQDASAVLDSSYRSLKAGVPVIVDGGTFREVLPVNSTADVDGRTRISWTPGLPVMDRDAPIADLTLHGRPQLTMRLEQAARADELVRGATEFSVATVSHFRVADVVLVSSEGVQMGARVLGRYNPTNTIALSVGLITSLRRSATTVTRAQEVGSVSGRIRPGETQLSYNEGVFSANRPQSGDLLLVVDDAGIELATVAQAQGGIITLTTPILRAMRPMRATHGGSFSGAGAIELHCVKSRFPPFVSAVRAQVLGDLPGVYASGTSMVDLDKSYDDLEENSLVAVSDGIARGSYSIRSATILDGRTRLTLNGTLPASLRVASLLIHARFEYAMRIDGHDRADVQVPMGTSQLQLLGTGLGLVAGSHLILDDSDQSLPPQGVRITQVAESAGVTLLSLARPLERAFALANTVIYGNVVQATHGTSVAEEVLGSGDPAIAQPRFTLRRSPLSFAPDATRARGVAANLEVFVSEKRWSEVDSLAESGPLDEHYVLEFDDEQVATICFGDGTHGAAPSSGRNNIRARYRVGLGATGNVDHGRLRQMPQALPFVESTLNPAAIGGGTDRETPVSAKQSIYRRVRTLDRAVSLVDYADLALTFSGIAKARADYGREQGTGAKTVLLTVAAAGGAPLGVEAKEALHAFFRLRAPRRPALVIRDARRIAVRVALQVTVLPDYLLTDVERRVLAALGPGVDEQGLPAWFSFDRRALGEDLHLSELYAVVENVRGVDHVLATAFHAEGQATAVLDRLPLDADAWTSGGDAVDAALGRLSVTLSGGLL